MIENYEFKFNEVSFVFDKNTINCNVMIALNICTSKAISSCDLCIVLNNDKKLISREHSKRNIYWLIQIFTNDLHIPKMFRQCDYFRCHSAVRPEIVVENDGFFQYLKKLISDFLWGKQLAVVAAPSRTCIEAKKNKIGIN